VFKAGACKGDSMVFADLNGDGKADIACIAK
jgi:FG-GAP repeat